MTDELASSFDRAAGRARGARAASPDPSLERPAASLERIDAFAQRVVEVGRRVAALPPCPAPLLSRAIALFEARRPAERGVAVAWRLLFDSWRAAVPALRGGGRTRFLRFGGRGGRLDLELVVGDDDGVRLRGTVDGLSGPLALDVVPRRGARVEVPVRAGGAFAASLPAGSGSFTVAVRSGRTTLSRTGRIPPVVRASRA